MAITQTNTLLPSNNTDAIFRAWTKFVRDAFVAGGWVQTADAGQIDFVTAAHPTAVDQDVGYVVLRMADSLQATRPVYVRLTFGSAHLSANFPRIGIGIGTGSNGAGSLTGGLGSATLVTLSDSIAVTDAFSYSSAAPGRAQVMLWDSTNSNLSLHFSIERGRDSAGNIDGGSLYFVHSVGGGALTTSQVLRPDGGDQGIEQTRLCMIIAPGRVTAAQENYGVGLVLPIGADAVVMRPATGYLVTSIDDYLTGARLTMYVHGQPVVYRRTQACTPSIGANGGTEHIVWMRFD